MRDARELVPKVCRLLSRAVEAGGLAAGLRRQHRARGVDDDEDLGIAALRDRARARDHRLCSRDADEHGHGDETRCEQPATTALVGVREPRTRRGPARRACAFRGTHASGTSAEKREQPPRRASGS